LAEYFSTFALTSRGRTADIGGPFRDTSGCCGSGSCRSPPSVGERAIGAVR
jgi:hypothetical protein